jgi:hypothetical protein
MMAFFRLGLLYLVFATVMYFLLTIYFRSLRREALEKEWDGDPAREGGTAAERDAFVEAGVAEWKHSFRRRLIWLVYVIPVLIIGVVMYYVNW